MKIKDLKEAIANHWSLEVGTIKLLLSGASNTPNSTRLCDLPRLSSPVTVTVLSGSQAQSKINEIEKAKYDQDAAEIEKNLKAALERSKASTLVSSSAPSSSSESFPSSNGMYPSSSSSYASSGFPSSSSSSQPSNPPFSSNTLSSNASGYPKFEEMTYRGRVELEIPIFSGACLPSGKPPSEHSNQIILPTSVLKRLTEAEVDFPILMRVSRRLPNGREVFSHVLPAEYRDRIDACYAPAQVLKKLGAYSKREKQEDDNKKEEKSDGNMKIDEIQRDGLISNGNGNGDGLSQQSSSQEQQSSLQQYQPQFQQHSQQSSQSSMDVDPSHQSESDSFQDEGFIVRLETVKLPKGNTATFQPFEFEWTSRVPEEQQRPLLENQLRHYSCLTSGDEIAIEHEGREYHFEIVQVSSTQDHQSSSQSSPNQSSTTDAISLLGEVDLAVNILMPVSSPSHKNLDSILSPINTSLDNPPKVEHELTIELKKGESCFFDFTMDNANAALLFEMQSFSGLLPSLFASTIKPYPTPSDHTWSFENAFTDSNTNTGSDMHQDDSSEASIASSHHNDSHQEDHQDSSSMDLAKINRLQRKMAQTGRQRLFISNAHPSFHTGKFFLGVYAEWADASASLKIVGGPSSIITSLVRDTSSSSGGLSLLSSSSELSLPPPDGSVRCDHCNRIVPSSSFGLHEIQCKRRNFVCPKCKWVGPISDVEKHNSIAHPLVKCECGFEGEADLAKLHREYECHLRPFTCPYCHLSMRYGLRASHLAQCGSRTSLCPTCNTWVKLYDLASHNASLHPDHQDDMQQDELKE